jgi:ATP-dependent helicase/nuclease subunit A
MNREQQLDFAALESKAVRTLTESEPARLRMGRQFRVVMVDEAQDVNPIQNLLLSSLGIETEIIVGDGQQSIYGFRQADVEQFRRKAKRGTHLRLSKNFRVEVDNHGILRFVDKVFGGLWGEEYAPMLPPGELDPNVVQLPDFSRVELWEHRAKDSDLTASYIAELIAEGEEPGDIVVLVRTSSHGAEIESALLRRNIEAKTQGETERFYSRMEIRDLANGLASLGNRYDDFSLLAALGGPLAGISFSGIVELSLAAPVADAIQKSEVSSADDRQRLEMFNAWFLPLSRRADRLPAWEVIAEIFSKSPYLEALGVLPNAHQAVANARKLLTLAVQSPELGPIEFADQIREIRELRHKEGDAPTTEGERDVVRIMNIHKAKGLEFEVVVLPQMFDPLVKGNREVEIDPRLPMVAACFRRNARIPYHQWLGEERKAREVSEELRVLYVAMTRAKRRLCVAIAPNLTKDCLARRLANVLGWRGKEPGGFERIRRIRESGDL